jgi:enoyl-[acyl-carrier protein] reductase/trans-2-enoyl-CoA reductase (NAD+)
MDRLFRERLYTGAPMLLDDKGRIRVDDWEMRDDVQSTVAELWEQADTDTLPAIGDLAGYKSDFLNLFGFGFEGVDYPADINENVQIEGLQ